MSAWQFLSRPPEGDDAPNHFVMASRSKDFALTKVHQMQNEAGAAETKLDNVYDRHTGESYQDNVAVDAAEQHLDEAVERLEHSKSKYRWENASEWKRALLAAPAACTKYTLALLARVDWNKILKRGLLLFFLWHPVYVPPQPSPEPPTHYTL